MISTELLFNKWLPPTLMFSMLLGCVLATVAPLLSTAILTASVLAAILIPFRTGPALKRLYEQRAPELLEEYAVGSLWTTRGFVDLAWVTLDYRVREDAELAGRATVYSIELLLSCMAAIVAIVTGTL